MKIIDLRSDTVTQPSAAMRRAMAAADVGDDVYGEDPTVNRLEEMAAELTGQEAALFLPSGTQSNLVALLGHCQRGEEYIVGQQAHTYKYEAGGAAVLGSIQPQPIDFQADGTLDLDKVAAAIKPDDVHFAPTRLLALENTVGGKVLPMEYMEHASLFAARQHLALHLDGARICNAAAALGVSVNQIGAKFDSVSVCFSKGLGAPVGSGLCGDEEFIKRSRRWRKMLGGGMRQAGILAAGAIYALENNLTRLAEDHQNAQRLAEGLMAIDELRIEGGGAHTNMVFVRLTEADADALIAHSRERGILLGKGNPMRLVTHLDISAQDIETVLFSIKSFFARHRARDLSTKGQNPADRQEQTS